mmetsp:Transcript_50915/g.108779  ORF Transcript_50915/g.108779 Transcript_50915/m.108779 type:complete len:207 (+) Transcript_50915:924-1544(+)
MGEPAEEPVKASSRGGDVLDGGRERLAPVAVEGDADLAGLARAVRRAVARDCVRVREQQVVASQVRLGRCRLCPARGVLTYCVAERSRAPRLIQCQPPLHSISKERETARGIFLKVLDDAPIQPSAVLVLQTLRQIPMVQGDERLTSRGEESVNQRVVEGSAFRIYRTPTVWEQARPRYRETIGWHSELPYQLHVFRVTVVVITRN